MADLTVSLNGTPTPILLPENTTLALFGATRAAAAANRATLAAAHAEAATGPTYPNIPAGLAATTSGQNFAVDVGDGTVSIYRNDNGGAVFQRRLATADALAANSGFTLIKHKRPEVGTFARTAAAMDLAGMNGPGISALHWIDPNFDEDLRNGTLTEDVHEGLQAALDAVPELGAEIVLPLGRYVVNDRLLLRKHRTQLRLSAGTSIIGDPWMWDGDQEPFGSFLDITADDCSISGAGMGHSTIQVRGASQANAITFRHVNGGAVRGLTLRGNKATSVAITDDTFQSGLVVLNARAARPSAMPSPVEIDLVEVCDWMQYGIQLYGDLVEGGIDRVYVHDIGRLDDAHSRGAAIAITRGVRNSSVRRSILKRNKQDGIFMTSAGLPSYGIGISSNTITENGRWGISVTEEGNFRPRQQDGVTPIVEGGISGVTQSGNQIFGNGGGAFDSYGGVRWGTYDNVGYLLNLSSVGDTIFNNAGYGMIVQTNDHQSRRTSQVTIDSPIVGNGGAGLGLGAKLDDTVRWTRGKISGNIAGDVANFSNSRLVTIAAGFGKATISGTTLTVSDEGTDFILPPGAGAITQITPAENRTITIFPAGRTLKAGGNLTLSGDFVGLNNSNITLVCNGGGWIEKNRKAL